MSNNTQNRMIPNAPGWWWRDDQLCRVWKSNYYSCLAFEEIDEEGREVDAPVTNDGHWRGPCLSMDDLRKAVEARDGVWPCEHITMYHGSPCYTPHDFSGREYGPMNCEGLNWNFCPICGAKRPGLSQLLKEK